MPSTILDATIAEIKAADTVIDGAILYIQAEPARIQAAVDKALENGATAAELEPLTALIAEQQSKSDAIVAAMKANTPEA